MNNNKLSISILVALLCCATTVSARKREASDRSPVSYESTLPMPDTLARKSEMHVLTEPVEEARLGRASMRGRIGGYSSHVRTGIDVSRYQGYIDWDAVANDGQVGFVYMKATEGNSLVDRTYQTNLYGAKRAGLKVGCYHFFSPTVNPSEQFDNFSANYDMHQQELIPIIDVEKKSRFGADDLRARLNVFLELFERRYGFKPIIYTGVNFYNSVFSGWYRDYKFMIARYTDETPYLNDGKRYVLWQYTARGSVNGISGHVDQSRFHDNADLSDILR